jgi:endonuclease YncB( thermonuclease family)
MKHRSHGGIFLLVALLVFFHYALRGWDRGQWGAKVEPRLPGQVVGSVDGNAIYATPDGGSQQGRWNWTGPGFSGKVVRVVDGDTIEVMHDGRPERVRLNAVDCPEKGQAFGTRAKEFTSNLVFGQIVTIQSSGQDRYGRTIGDVILTDGRSLNQELVKAGMAWWYRQYSHDRTLESLESEARSHRRGLWADAHPIAPWDRRHGGKPSALP